MNRKAQLKTEFPLANAYDSGMCFVIVTVNGETSFTPFKADSVGLSKAWVLMNDEAKRVKTLGLPWTVTMWDTRPTPQK